MSDRCFVRHSLQISRSPIMYASLALGTADTLHEHRPSAPANMRRRSLGVTDTSISIFVAVKVYIHYRAIHKLVSLHNYQHIVRLTTTLQASEGTRAEGNVSSGVTSPAVCRQESSLSTISDRIPLSYGRYTRTRDGSGPAPTTSREIFIVVS
jgi:hypothetical protein